MKAAYIERPGPPESIQYGELPEPTPGEGEVLVRVLAVTVNPVDCYIRGGKLPMDLPVPFVIGRDMTGLVTVVGSKVRGFKPGDHVWSNGLGVHGRQGPFAEYVAAPEERLYRLPGGVDPQQAVAVLHSALTAVIGLFHKARLTAGETLFVNGGSGNVGTAVLQLARACLARVAVTAGDPEKAAWCRERGADRVIDYHAEDVAEALRAFAPQGLDVYWEATGTLDLDLALSVLAPHGRIVVMAGLDRRCPFPVGPFYTRDCTIHGFAVTNATVDQLQACARQINGLLTKGALRARIQAVWPLSRAAEAHHLQEQGRLSGKIVLLPGA